MPADPSASCSSDGEFDAVVVGTGLSESILAAALSVSGARVLHVDKNDYYGDDCATIPIDDPFFVEEGSQAGWRARRSPVPQEADRGQVADQMNQIRVDLLPKPLMASSLIVDILAKSSLGHYVDFKALQSIQIDMGNGNGNGADVETVPASRADVFKSRFISVSEKRLLMRFLNRCAATDPEDTLDPDKAEGSFGQLMTTQSLSPKLQTVFANSIAFTPTHSSSRDGILAVRRYCQSMLRFKTTTAFLVPNYGTSELAQAFCRLCAVYGGQYRLRTSIASFIRKQSEERWAVKLDCESGPVEVETRFLFGNWRNLYPDAPVRETGVKRFVGITDRSLSGDLGRLMRVLPAGTCGNKEPIFIRQFDSSLQICPSGRFVVHIDAHGSHDSVDDAVSYLFQRQHNCPTLLWAQLLHRTECCPQDAEKLDNLGLVPTTPTGDIDASRLIADTKALFLTARPDSAFLDEFSFVKDL